MIISNPVTWKPQIFEETVGTDHRGAPIKRFYVNLGDLREYFSQIRGANYRALGKKFLERFEDVPNETNIDVAEFTKMPQGDSLLRAMLDIIPPELHIPLPLIVPRTVGESVKVAAIDDFMNAVYLGNEENAQMVRRWDELKAEKQLRPDDMVSLGELAEYGVLSPSLSRVLAKIFRLPRTTRKPLAVKRKWRKYPDMYYQWAKEFYHQLATVHAEIKAKVRYGIIRQEDAENEFLEVKKKLKEQFGEHINSYLWREFGGTKLTREQEVQKVLAAIEDIIARRPRMWDVYHGVSELNLFPEDIIVRWNELRDALKKPVWEYIIDSFAGITTGKHAVKEINYKVVAPEARPYVEAFERLSQMLRSMYASIQIKSIPGQTRAMLEKLKLGLEATRTAIEQVNYLLENWNDIEKVVYSLSRPRQMNELLIRLRGLLAATEAAFVDVLDGYMLYVEDYAHMTYDEIIGYINYMGWGLRPPPWRQVLTPEQREILDITVGWDDNPDLYPAGTEASVTKQVYSYVDRHTKRLKDRVDERRVEEGQLTTQERRELRAWEAEAREVLPELEAELPKVRRIVEELKKEIEPYKDYYDQFVILQHDYSRAKKRKEELERELEDYKKRLVLLEQLKMAGFFEEEEEKKRKQEEERYKRQKKAWSDEIKAIPLRIEELKNFMKNIPDKIKNMQNELDKKSGNKGKEILRKFKKLKEKIRDLEVLEAEINAIKTELF